MSDRPKHSPLGASGAERWMKCPGSVTLLRDLRLPESDEPDYRREGTAMHEAAAHCLNNGLDAWEVVGQTFYKTVIAPEMGDAIQVYLDHVVPIMKAAGADAWVEYPISSPVHKDFYGTCDFGAAVVEPDGKHVLHVIDLKGGAGILVEAEDNPQLKYYAFGLIDGLERSYQREMRPEHTVRLAICQPRITWTDSPVREWETTVGEIKAWVHGTLVPAMNATAVDHSFDSGEHCRFCPAKLACPLLTSLFRAAATHNPKDVVHLDNDSLGRAYQLGAAVKHYITALETEAFRRLNKGEVPTGTKLVKKKANRVLTEIGQKLAKERFGDDAMTEPKVKSPAELEKLSPQAAAFVKEHAYTPDTGYTVALASDPRQGVLVKPAAEVFKAAVKALDLTGGSE